jgi:hypothetical protein
MILAARSQGNALRMCLERRKHLPVTMGHRVQWRRRGFVRRNDLNLMECSEMPEEPIGHVVDFFARPVVAAIQLTAPLKVGDKIHIKGHSTDLELTVASMQLNNAPVQEGKAGEGVGVKISDRARKGDAVFKIVE